MTFAAKIGKDETIKLTTQQQTFLTITNVALAPKESVSCEKIQKANLYLRQRKSNDLILIVELDRQRVKSYSCNIRLPLKRDQSQQLFSENGETNVIGNVESSVVQISITREKKEFSKKVDEQQNKIQARPKRSVSFSKKETTEPKIRNKKQENIKKPKNLLQMMNNLDKEDSQESDDQSYSQESQSQESDDSQQSNQQEGAAPKQIAKTKQSHENNRNKKKKSSWAQILQEEMNAQSQELDKSKEQPEQEEQLDDDKTPQAPPKTQIMKRQRQILERKKVSAQNSYKKQIKKRTKDFSHIIFDDELDQEAFQYVVPNGLPSFLKKS